MTNSSYTISVNGFRKIQNSTIEWKGQVGIRVSDSANTEVVDSTIYMDYGVENRTYAHAPVTCLNPHVSKSLWC